MCIEINSIYTNMSITDDDHNIIQKILNNESDYIELKILPEHVEHYEDNYEEYVKIYEGNDFLDIIKYVFPKNEYIDSLYIDYDVGVGWNDIETSLWLSLRQFKSIYIGGCSEDVVKHLSKNKNDKLEKLKLSSFFKSERYIASIVETYESLKCLDLRFANDHDLQRIITLSYSLKKSHIEEFIINYIPDFSYHSFLLELIDCVGKNKRLKRISLYYDGNEKIIKDVIRIPNVLKNNYTLTDFVINGKYNYQDIENTMIRNRKYMMMILLCMNRRIIPRCVFKNMILDAYFV